VANGAKGQLYAKVVAPSGAEDEALVQSLDDSDCEYYLSTILLITIETFSLNLSQ